MNNDFQVTAIPRATYADLLDGGPLPNHARWLHADHSPGFPCRVSLRDAAVGERVLALTHNHHEVDSPYHASGPVFIRQHATTAAPAVNEVPKMLRHRQLSLRGYDDQAMMIAAVTVEGTALEAALREMFGTPSVRYIHIHNAAPGCFNCSVERAWSGQ